MRLADVHATPSDTQGDTVSSIDEQFLLQARLIHGLGMLALVMFTVLGAIFIWRALRGDVFENSTVAAVLLFAAATVGSLALSPFIASWFAPDYYTQQYRGAECAKRVMT